jgi:hypothetical protein
MTRCQNCHTSWWRICLLCCAALLAGCQSWANPFYTKPSATPEDIARFGPTANERITKYTEQQKAGPGDPSTHLSKVNELFNKINSERDPAVRAAIIKTVAIYPVPQALALLKMATQDPSSRVRLAAAEGWGLRSETEALEQLQKLYKSDEDLDVRQMAIKSLGKLKQPAAAQVVGSALEDKDPAVQYLAMQSLRDITGKDLGNDVNQWREYMQLPAEQRPQQESLVQQWFPWMR